MDQENGNFLNANETSTNQNSGSSDPRSKLLGVTDTTPAPQQPNAPLSEAAAEVDKWYPPANPDEYRMPKLVGRDDEYTSETMAFDRQVRGWLSDARFPQGAGSSVAEEIFKFDDQWQKMDEVQREIWVREQESVLRNLWGEKTEERLALGRQLVEELEKKSPGIVALLEETGATNSLPVVLQFVLQAERLYMRAG